MTSLPLLEELARVLARPRLQRIRPYSASEADLYVAMIQSRAEVVPTRGGLKICRDPHDDELLEAALTGKARYLVSRDADFTRDLALIRLFSERGVKIVTVQQCLEALAPRR